MRESKPVRWKISRCVWVAFLVSVLGGAYPPSSLTGSFAAEVSLLGGRITSSSGRAIAGIPVRAHRENSNITVAVYTNSRGDYSYPAWSDLSPGSYSVAIELPDFVPVEQEASLSTGKTLRLDFTLQPRQPSINDATAAEIAMAMPGTEEQRHLLSECGQCHTLQLALKSPHSKEAWLQLIKFMAGPESYSREDPGTRDFRQKRYMDELADYLASVRGPGSSEVIPFKPRSRPTGEASTRLVVTEYDVPQGGSRELFMTRGDRRFAWPHDAVVDPNGRYVWYTDNHRPILGRLDKKTGEIKEFDFRFLPGMGRDVWQDPRRRETAYLETGGANKIGFLPDGNIVIAPNIARGTIIFDPRTEEFKVWPTGSVFFGIDPAGNVWYGGPALHRLNPKSGEVTNYPAPPSGLGYDVDEDSQGRFVYNVWRGGKVGIFDPKTEKYTEYPTPTPGSGPRRGQVDAKDRWWTGLFWAGRLAMFDPSKGEVKEFPLIPDVKPYGAPFLAPYTAAVDDKNQIVWVSDFNSSRIYRFDMKTERSTEFFMPAPYEIRNLAVDRTAVRPTLWIPAYRPPSKIVRVQVW